MRLLLVAVGRMKAGPERDLLGRYLERAQAGGRGLGFTAVTELEIEESRSRDADRRKEEEARAILAKLPQGARLLLLDEGGAGTSSAGLARMVGDARDRGDPAFCFVVGGPDGLAPRLLGAHAALGFGAVTFPHQLVRVLVAEQIYRVTTILAGHPYHRA